MKVKSLLLAVAAVAALGANAQAKLILPDIDTKAADFEFGKVFEMPITVQMIEGDDMTNNQLVIVFPEGVKPAQDAYGSYCFEGADVAKAGRVPAISYSDNFGTAEGPMYKVVGANMTKTPTTVNPMEFLILNVMVEEGVKPGKFQCYLKYNTSKDDSREIGHAVPGENEGEIIYTWADDTQMEGGNVFAETAVNDINTAKAVSSVKYYNAAGMESDQAFEGINIVVTKYADGSQSTAKIVK